MTLQQLFDHIANNPTYLIFFFCIIPIAALLAGWLGKDEGHLSPWKYLYSTMIYLVAVPGIFAITLFIYQFLFERSSILNMDVYTQVLPVVSMILTFFISRKNVDLEDIPGLAKLSGLIMMITAVFAIMWFVDRTRILAFSYLRIEYVLLTFVVLLLVVRFGWKKVMKSEGSEIE